MPKLVKPWFVSPIEILFPARVVRPAIAYARAMLAFVMVFALFVACPAPKAIASGDSEVAPPGRTVNVHLDDLPIAFPVDPFLMESTTMVPLRALSEALGFTVTWEETGTVICDKGETSINLTIGDPLVLVNDEAVTLRQPPTLAGDHTVVPLRFFSEAMGFAVDWDPEEYTAWVTSPKSKVPVWGFYALGNSEYSSWEDLFGDKYPFPAEPGPDSPASHTAGAFLGWFAVDDSGDVNDDDSAGFRRPDGWQAVMMRLRMSGSKAVAMYFANNTNGRLSALLADPITRQRLAMSIESSAAIFDGVALDFEGLGAYPETRETDAANFTAFLETLSTLLGDSPLTVALPPLNGYFLGYDHARIGELADSVVLMAYDYQEPGKPSPTAPWKRVDEALRLELEQVPAEKLILGVPAYGIVYATASEGTIEASRPAAKDPVGNGTESEYDPYLCCEYSTWADGETTFHAYTESNRSLAARVSLAKRYSLAGVAIWRLGLLQEGWVDAVKSVAEPLR